MNPAHIDILTLTVMATTEIVKAGQLIGYEGAPASAGEPVLGLAKYDAAVGQSLAVIAQGLVEAKAATNIAAGDAVYADENGQPTNVGDSHPCGVAFQGGAAGDVIAILLK